MSRRVGVATVRLLEHAEIPKERRMTNEATSSRGNYLIKGGAVITVDPKLGTLPKPTFSSGTARSRRLAPISPRRAPKSSTHPT